MREKLIKIGAKVVRHAKYVTFQMAEVAVPRRLYRAILDRIRRFAPDANPTSTNVIVTEASIPSQPPGVCDVGADNLGNECALRAFRQASFARTGTFEHTCGQTQAISNCVTAGRRYAAGMEARRRSRARVKWEI